MEVIRTSFIRGYTQVLEVDIADFFGSLDHELLVKLLGERISDRRVLKLVKGWLKAGVLDEGTPTETLAGVPQGGVISPLLANIYLNVLDQIWEQEGTGILVRFADDAVILCRTQKGIERAEETIKFCLAALGLEANEAKTRRVDLREGREGFDFLGCHFHARVSGKLLEQGVQKYYLHRWPLTRSINRVRRRVKELTNRRARSGMRRPRGDRRPQSGAPRLGQLLSDRQRRRQVHADRQLCLAQVAPLAGPQAGTKPKTGSSRTVDGRLV